MTASTTVKIAELAPTPKAMVSTATAVKAGCLRRARAASRSSRNIFPSLPPACTIIGSMGRAADSIERLALPASDADLRALAALLVDAVESGAAVSFLAPLTLEDAERWWRDILTRAEPRAAVLVARDAA